MALPPIPLSPPVTGSFLLTHDVLTSSPVRPPCRSVPRVPPAETLPINWQANAVGSHSLTANCGDTLQFNWPEGTYHDIVEVPYCEWGGPPQEQMATFLAC